jgi:hypothetical protein
LIELTDVERAIACDASLRRGAVARRRARVVAALERADERRVAVAVEAARLGEAGVGGVVARAREDEERGGDAGDGERA